MYFIIAIAFATLVAIFVVTPVLAPGGAREGALPVDITPLGHLKRRRMVVYENLQDLEFEYSAGKMSEQDFQSMRENYMAEAADLMLASQEQEAAGEQELWIEKEVAARRSQKKEPNSSPYVCQECGFESPLPVKFCGNCGARFAEKEIRSQKKL